MDAEVKIRYRNKAVPCTIEPSGEDNYLVRFARPRKAVTPGQSAVFYDGDRVLGGGIILEATREKGKHEEEHQKPAENEGKRGKRSRH
ncbi:MAG: aminomethyltransferase beta-barrel domain-containing protein [Candidatus Marinimicrobia bacterium]|nr:aminomethyltransferase beta-barrel domain-containing protein [Candidatus Neomarinimicrobiota bacterium]